MDATVRTPVVTFALLGLMWIGLTAGPPRTQAQLVGAADNAQPAEPGLALDIDALLSDDRVFQATIDSQVWTITPQPGRRMIQVPYTVTPGSETTRLASPSLKLRGGRFVAWRIIDDEQDTHSLGSQSAQPTYRDNPLSIGSLRNTGLDDLGQLDRPGQPAAQADAGAGLTLEDTLPENIPVLARDMTISPTGVIHWEMERAIAGAEVKSGQDGYFLKLRPDRMQGMEPQRPERSGRQAGGRGTGQDARQAAAQQRAAELEYRNKATAYRELRDQVRKLPDEFSANMPSRLWAVYEVSDRVDELSFTGEAPMPWAIELSDLETLQSVASGRGGGTAELTAADFTAVSQMTLMLADGHPVTQRAVASTMASAQMLGRAKQGDALYRLIDKLLKSGDSETVRIAAGGLAATTPPTPATLSLLRGALADMDPGSKLLALSGLLSSQENDPAGQRQMISTANQMMVDPDGPGVTYVLEQLAGALADKPDAVMFVGSGIRFDTLGEAELDKAIVFVANAAGDSPVAAEWMDKGLLGANDPAVVSRTLEVLGTSAPGGGFVSMMTKRLMVLSFGPPNKETASRAKPPLRGIVKVPINATGHSIYRALNAGDPEVRSMGWKALRHFQVRNEAGYASGQPQGLSDSGDQPDRMGLILDAAFGETVTPPQLVVFLAHQEEQAEATEALVRVVVEGRGPAITQAARALVRSGRPLGPPIQALTPDQRGALAVRLYEAVTGSSPMVAGLMRVEDGRSPLVNWFAQHVSSSGLPDTEDWAPAANGEENLLSLAASSDPALADGAVAGLVASAGGDETLARDLARQMSSAPDRSVQGLRDRWGEAKQEIFVSRLTHAAGRYRLVVNLRGSSDGGFGGGFQFPGRGGSFETAANLPLIKSFNLASVELQADGQSLGLASGTLTLGVPESHLAISLLNPTELKDFGNDELADIPIEDVDGSIDLLPQKDGSWRGASALLDGRSVEVVFDPE